jgi:hypothetical protein
MKIIDVALGLVMVSAALVSHASPVVIDSINASLNPLVSTFNTDAIGWTYTPAFAYTLEGVETRFSVVNSPKNVTVEVYDELPSSSGTLLLSSTFLVTTTGFEGGLFAGLNLVAGEDYFIGFKNVQGLGSNITFDIGAVALADAWVQVGSTPYNTQITQIEVRQPVIRFLGVEAQNNIPEPSGLVLTGLALAVLASRNRKKQNFQNDCLELR